MTSLPHRFSIQDKAGPCGAGPLNPPHPNPLPSGRGNLSPSATGLRQASPHRRIVPSFRTSGNSASPCRSTVRRASDSEFHPHALEKTPKENQMWTPATFRRPARTALAEPTAAPTPMFTKRLYAERVSGPSGLVERVQRETPWPDGVSLWMTPRQKRTRSVGEGDWRQSHATQRR